jgi:hypothetical protein
MPKLKMELNENDLYMLEVFLMRLDEEIGSTINSVDNQTTVLNNMRRCNNVLHDIKEMFDIEF